MSAYTEPAEEMFQASFRLILVDDENEAETYKVRITCLQHPERTSQRNIPFRDKLLISGLFSERSY